MSTPNLNKPANDCGCCEGQAHSTPQRIYNRIGLPTIGYRVGDYHSFKQSMLARLSSSDLPQLHALTTRDENDFSIALIDAWAVTSEVLCFYQEYFANEGLLRTAKERLSILEHARLIGYQLHPGVAANSYIAFTMDEAPAGTDNPLLTTTIEAGAKIQSTPGPDETAQLYETEHEIQARVDWNKIRPRLSQPQQIHADMESVVLNGIRTFVKPGDEILIVNGSSKNVKKVQSVHTNINLNITQLVLSSLAPSPESFPEPSLWPGEYQYFDGVDTLTLYAINLFVALSWNIQDVIAIIESKHWDLDEVMQVINANSELNTSVSSSYASVHGFHKRANLFGYNAQKRVTYLDAEGSPNPNGVPNDISEWTDWDVASDEGNRLIYLSTEYSEIISDSYLILNNSTDVHINQVTASSSLPRTAYGISSKSSRLELSADLLDGDKMDLIREAELLVQSEALDLAQVPINDIVSNDRITLDKADLYLRNQQFVALSGESADQEGMFYSEVLQIKEVRLERGFTQLIFTTNLKHPYKRDSVFINANVATVSHGESVSEVLGNGDAGLMSQKFILKQTPLTYVSAETSSGTASTLEIRVNSVLWHEVETFLDTQSDEKIFTTKLNDDGSTIIYFGDGINGARLPSGNNNVIANYRKGIGLDGLVKSTQLNLLLTRPLGIKDASNPIASSGADDAEVLENARSNAPLGLLTLGRAVSLQDYEDYCRSFAGVRKAQAIAISHHGVSRIYITLAGPNGALIESGSKTHNDLLSSLKGSGDPFVQFSLLTYRPAFFKLDAELYIHPDYVHDLVIEDAQNALREAFSFDIRTFNQAVYLSEVIETLQHVEGVIAVDINQLYRSDATPMSPVPDVLKTTNTSSSIGAELLLLDPAPLDQIRVKS